MRNLSLDEVLKQFNDSVNNTSREEVEAINKGRVRISTEEARNIINSDTEIGHKAKALFIALHKNPLFLFSIAAAFELCDIGGEELFDKVTRVVVQVVLDNENGVNDDEDEDIEL